MKFLILYSAFWIQHSIYCQQADTTIDSGLYFEEKGNLAFGQDKINDAKTFYLKASSAYQEESNYKDQVNVLNYLSYIYYSIDKNIVKYNSNSLRAYDIATNHLGIKNEYYISALEELSTNYYSLGDYDKSINLKHGVIDSRIAAKQDKLIIANSYNGLGNIYKFIGDSKNAILYFRKAAALLGELRKNKPDDDVITMYNTTYTNMALYYEKIELPDSAYHYLRLAKPYIELITKKNTLAKHYLQSARLNSTTGNLKLAEQELRKANQNIADNAYYQVYYKEEKAKLLLLKNKPKKSLETFQTAHKLAASTNKKNTASFKSKRLIKMYELAQKLRDETLALNYLNEGIAANLYNTETEVSISDLTAANFRNKLEVLYFCAARGQYFHEQYIESNQDNLLHHSYNSYLLASDLVNSIRTELQTKDSKTNLATQNKSVTEGALLTAHQLFEKTGDRQYLEKAFEITEQNKALLLLENINEENAKGYTTLPDSLLNLERELTLRITQLEKIKLENAGKVDNDVADELNELLIQNNQLINKLERDYPAYHDIKYKENDLSVMDVQSSLLSDQAVIEYYVGEENIYQLVITHNSEDYFLIPKEERIQTSLDSVMTLISRPPKSAQAKIEFEQYKALSSTLYAKLIAKAIQSLDTNIKSLTLVTHGALNNLPFEILLSDTEERPGYGLESLQYLFEDYAIDYQYSLIHKNSIKAKSDRTYDYDFLGFAPTFSSTNIAKGSGIRNCEEVALENLQCSAEELKSIEELLSHENFLGEDATKENFHTQVNAARIIHLATHTCLNNTYPSLNKIYFSDGNYTLLDLNNLKIAAELVVLSACNTGIGEFVEGDGVQSLSWSFINGGCKSTLMSLWSIDDCATSEFMGVYYKNLKAGQRKNEALHKAKTTYLATAPPEKQHPFYWASFVTYGDMEAMNFNSGLFKPYYLIFLGFALLLIVIYMLQTRKSKS